MNLPDRLRLPIAFDPERLRGDLAALDASAWVRHFVTQNYDGDWSVVPLRAAAGARHPIQMIYPDPAATVFEDTPLLDACPYFREVIDAFGDEVRPARLMRLTPGSVIKAHRDHELGIEYGVARLHIPVRTNPEVEFLLNGTRVEMAPGSAWYLRLSDPHSVANRGRDDRIHLVLDVTVTEALRRTLEAAALAEA